MLNNFLSNYNNKLYYFVSNHKNLNIYVNDFLSNYNNKLQ